MFKRCILACTLALLCYPVLSTGQQTDRDKTVRLGTEEVLLDLVVRDKRGRPVRDLKASEVEVLEDGLAQRITSFRRVDAPSSAEQNRRPDIETGRLSAGRFEVRAVVQQGESTAEAHAFFTLSE
jgi:hypothetical protein